MYEESSPLLTTPEAADYLRLALRTLERHRVAGTGPRFVKAGKRVLYHVNHLDEWIEARSFSSTAEVEKVLRYDSLVAASRPKRRICKKIGSEAGE